MIESNSFFKYPWPHWKKLNSGWWLTAIGTLIAIILFLFPTILSIEFWIKSVVILILVFSPLLISSLIFLCKVITVTLRRILNYSKLLNEYQLKICELENAKKMILNLLKELTPIQRFNIEKVILYDKKLFIHIQKKKEMKLENGYKLGVFDLLEGNLMGLFKITEERNNEYIAQNFDYISPVWLGYIHQTGTVESTAPPNTIAVYLQNNGEYYE